MRKQTINEAIDILIASLKLPKAVSSWCPPKIERERKGSSFDIFDKIAQEMDKD